MVSYLTKAMALEVNYTKGVATQNNITQAGYSTERPMEKVENSTGVWPFGAVQEGGCQPCYYSKTGNRLDNSY